MWRTSHGTGVFRSKSVLSRLARLQDMAVICIMVLIIIIMVMVVE